MRAPLRAAGSYLAGLGTAGSLLAGAAAMFVLGSAIVAFRGWPQISTGPASVMVAAGHPAPPSRVARRLAAVLRTDRATGGAALAPAVGRRVAPGHKAQPRGHQPVGGPGVVGSPSSGVSAAPSGSSATAVSAGGPSTTGCGSPCGRRPGPSGLVSKLTKTLAQAVSNVGSSVGSGVSSASKTAGGAVNGVSPQAGSTVQNVGKSAGSTVSGTSSTAANTLSQAGSALSGGH